MNVDCARKENDKVFTLITKRIKRESTHCYVKSRRINYAKKNYLNIFVCANKRKKKATFIRISRDSSKIYNVHRNNEHKKKLFIRDDSHG